MPLEIGQVEAIFRYPVKSMRGERLEVAQLGWHGLDGDRRLAFRRIDNRGGFPWLTASKLPDLLLFAPLRREEEAQGDLPTHVRCSMVNLNQAARDWDRRVSSKCVLPWDRRPSRRLCSHLQHMPPVPGLQFCRLVSGSNAVPISSGSI